MVRYFFFDFVGGIKEKIFLVLQFIVFFGEFVEGVSFFLCFDGGVVVQLVGRVLDVCLQSSDGEGVIFIQCF